MDPQDVFSFRRKSVPIGPWTIHANKEGILQSKCTCKDQLKQHATDQDNSDSKLSSSEASCNICDYISKLPKLKCLPDMLFHKNILKIEHKSGPCLEFNALDALKFVEESQDPLRVAVADGWQNARADFPFARKIFKPYDWTYTTNYKGTLSHLSGSDKTTCDEESFFSVEPTTDRIDLEKLKEREEIVFYDDITLYEDELADHGVSKYSVKVRVMPSCFFILARFYLRIDGVLARINDTRVYHRFRSDHLLREYTNREATISSLNLPLSIVLDPNQLMAHLPLIESKYDKLILPQGNK